jgi:hypothetical protein
MYVYIIELYNASIGRNNTLTYSVNGIQLYIASLFNAVYTAHMQIYIFTAFSP